MPQLVKGGKYVFGWTTINSDLQIRIPDETFDEYKFIETDKLIIMSGSKASGGFSINSPYSIVNSKFGYNIIKALGYIKESDSFTVRELEIVKPGERWLSWTYLDKEKYFKLSDELINTMATGAGAKLLVIRGSGTGPAFITKGIIYNEALNHKDIIEFC